EPVAYLQALREWLRRLTGTFRRNADDLERELGSHLEMAEEELRRRGHSSDEAARLARARFGIPARAMERLRDQQGVPWLGRFSLDVTLALRMLRKHWGVTSIAGIAMAIPIALGAVLFAFVEATLWKTPPLDEGDRLVAL